MRSVTRATTATRFRTLAHGRAVAAVAVALALTITDAAQAADLGLEVRATPQSRRALPRIAISVPPGAADAVRTVYVVSRVEDPPRDVTLTATVEDAQATLSPTGLLPLTDRSSVVPVRISVPNPDRSLTGALVATAGQRGQTLAQIAVKHDPNAVISIEGADDQGVKRLAPAEEMRERFTIVSGTDTPITDLRIAVAPFRDPEGQQTVPDVTVDGAPLREGAPYAIPGRGRRTLAIAARLPVGGEYVSAIELRYGLRAANVPLHVRRTHVAPTVALTDPGSVQASTGRPASFQLELRETGGHVLLLPVPSLVLRRSDGDRAFSLSPGEVTLDGAQVSLRLEPGETRSVEVAVPGVQGPGRYAARISFGGEPEPKQATATVFVRRPVEQALLVMLIALALGEWARRLLSGRQLAQQRRTDVAALDGGLGRLAAGSTPVVEEQLAGLDRAVPPSTTNGTVAAALAGAADAVRAELLATRRTLDEVVTADAARTAAWRTWLDAAADQISALIDHVQELPGVEPAPRDRLRQQLVPDVEKIRDAKDPRVGIERYCDASAHYLETAASGLAALTAGRRRPDVGRLAEDSVRAAKAGNLARAWDGYTTALQVWNGSQPAAGVGPDSPREEVEEAVRRAAAAALPTTAGGATTAAPRVTTFGQPRPALVTSAIVGLLALLAGVIVLYLPDRTWGTLADFGKIFLFVAVIHLVVVSVALGVAQRESSL
jgi:hypothetical protein